MEPMIDYLNGTVTQPWSHFPVKANSLWTKLDCLYQPNTLLVEQMK